MFPSPPAQADSCSARLGTGTRPSLLAALPGAPLGPGWGPGHLGCDGAHAWWQDGYIRDAGRPRGHMAAPAQDARGRVVLRLLGSRLLVLARADARGERLALA